MSRPLSWSMRFALALSAVFALGTLSAGGMSYVLLSREMSQRLSADVRVLATVLARVAQDGDRAELIEQVALQARSINSGSGQVAFIDAVTGEAFGSLHLTAPFEGERRLVVDLDLPESSQTGASAAEAYLAYGIRTDLGWVIAARDEAWVAESGEILIQATAWALAIALLASVGLALVVARRNERRIDLMERVLEAVGAGQMHLRIADAGTDDIAHLAGQVDGMLGRLEGGVAAIRQVSTDVAHDLRAPLARLRMRLEPQAMSLDVPPDARHEIGTALLDIDAISATFDAILRLARLQSGIVDLPSQPVDLAGLAQDICDILEPSAHEAGHSLRAERPDDPVIVTGDRDLLSQALTNLIDNALRHCPQPADVTVRVFLDGGIPVLTVNDNGPGIAAADRDRVLDRFVRLDASRSVAGTGLGLSLVAAIADLHRARLTLEDNAPGLRVRIRFPAAAQNRSLLINM